MVLWSVGWGGVAWGVVFPSERPVLLQDLQNLGAQNVCVMTDARLALLRPVASVLQSLDENGVKFKVYDNVRVEPTDAR